MLHGRDLDQVWGLSFGWTHCSITAREAAVSIRRRDAGKVGLDDAREKARADYISKTDLVWFRDPQESS